MQKVWEDEKQIIFEENNLQYLQFKKLLEYPEIVHCYTLRSGNELDFPPITKNKQKYQESCKKICDCLNNKNQLKVIHKQSTVSKTNISWKLTPDKIIKPYQTHTDNVEIVNEVKNLENVDGLLTNQKELALLTTSADCISLLFFDPVQKVVGTVHSGWKGTLAGICKNAVKKMQEQYQSKVQDIICCICPSIRACHFEVDEDVKQLFYDKYQNLEQIDEIIKKAQVKEGKQKYTIDTVKINIVLLKQMGLKEENIVDSNLCTVCHSDMFHSYRVDKEMSGRNAALICLSQMSTSPK